MIGKLVLLEFQGGKIIIKKVGLENISLQTDLFYALFRWFKNFRTGLGTIGRG